MATSSTNKHQILKHLAKTIYFYELWKDFLTKAGVMVACTMLYFAHRTVRWEGLPIISASFDVLSFCIVICSIVFVRRMTRRSVVLVFKAALVLSIGQVCWYGKAVVYDRSVSRTRSSDMVVAIINPNQVPMGALFFLVAWSFDRFMIRNMTTAEQAVKALERKTD